MAEEPLGSGYLIGGMALGLQAGRVEEHHVAGGRGWGQGRAESLCLFGGTVEGTPVAQGHRAEEPPGAWEQRREVLVEHSEPEGLWES